MKTPLRFQATEYDCGSTSLINALSYLFDRNEIPPELIKGINSFTLDEFDKKGEEGEGGTSRYAMNMLSHWINQYAETRNLNLVCKRFEGEEVKIDKIKRVIEKKGVALTRLWQTNEHYAIVTDIDDEYVYLFDPYYFDETYYDEDKQVEIIFDQPFKYNRKVKLERFLSENKKDFALGKITHRECILIYHKS